MFLFVFSILPRRCPLLATFLSVLFCLLSVLISDSRLDLVWFRLSCDHGWIRSGSVNVRKTTNNNDRLQRCCCCLLFLTFSALVANPKKTTLHGGQSRSWSAEQGKKEKEKVWQRTPPPPRARCSFGEKRMYGQREKKKIISSKSLPIYETKTA